MTLAERLKLHKGVGLTWLWDPGKCCQMQPPCQSVPCALGSQIEPGDLQHGMSALRWWHYKCMIGTCSRCHRMDWAGGVYCRRAAGMHCWQGSKDLA